MARWYIWAGSGLCAAISFVVFATQGFAGDRLLFHKGWGKSLSSTYANYLTWDGSKWSVKVDGNMFTHAPNGDWAKAHKDTIINFIGWHGEKWTAKIDGDAFVVSAEDGFSPPRKQKHLAYVTHDGSYWSMAFSDLACDFSLSQNKEIQKCFGGSGNQCDGGDPNHPITLDNTGCMAEGYATIGSIMHDNCCLNVPTGYFCDGAGFLKSLAATTVGHGQSDRETCGQEWNKASNDSIYKRGWQVFFGPYFKGDVTDDMTRVEARGNALVYDSHGLFRRPWKEANEKDDPARWGNPKNGGIKETAASRRLKSSDAKFEFKEDAQFRQ